MTLTMLEKCEIETRRMHSTDRGSPCVCSVPYRVLFCVGFDGSTVPFYTSAVTTRCCGEMPPLERSAQPGYGRVVVLRSIAGWTLDLFRQAPNEKRPATKAAPLFVTWSSLAYKMSSPNTDRHRSCGHIALLAGNYRHRHRLLQLVPPQNQ